MMSAKTNAEWDIIIDTRRSLFDLKLRKVWDYRDLLFLLVRRDFVSFYKQTVLGPIWFFIQPIFTTLMFIFLFSNLAGLSTDGLPPSLFYIVGITAWSYFSETLMKISNVLRDNAGIFGKVYFPRFIIPLSILLSGLFKFGIQLILLLLVFTYYALYKDAIDFSPTMLLYPFLALLMALQSLGFGLVVASFATKYRDLAMLLGFGLQLMMYATPVVYPLSSMTGALHDAIALNPMTYVIEGMRYSLLGQGSVSLSGIVYVVVVTAIILMIGISSFGKTEKNFVDTV